MPADEPRSETIDVLRRVAGAAAVHIYEMEWFDDVTYCCNEFIGAGVTSLVGPISEGMDEEEAWEAAVHPDDRPAYEEFCEALKHGEPRELEYRLVGFDGVTRWVWERARPRTENGRRLVDGIVADVTDRRLFQEHLEQAIARAHRGNQAVAVLFVDLDDFKLVNDSHGHTTGDELLRVVADRLRGAVRATDVVARLGGDEFLVLVADIDLEGAAEAAERVAENIRAALSAPVRLAPGELYTHASIGASLYPADADSAEELLSKADIAMYRAKHAERHALRPAIVSSLDAADQLATVARLRGALQRDELVLHYQPLVALDESRMVGVEALIRWNDGERGLVGPDSFVALAERAGLIGSISDWVVESACAQVAEWRRAGIDVYVSVNMPAIMWRPAEIQRVLAAMRASGIPADRLMIEITESAAIARPGSLEPIMADLHERGLRVAIDDFGTGHSSLERLSQMRVTTLKIDRSFTAAVPDDRRVSLLVATIVQLARNLGLEPLAEGVETESQRRFLLEHGCMLGQGFYFSRAVPAEQIAELHARTVRRAA